MTAADRTNTRARVIHTAGVAAAEWPHFASVADSLLADVSKESAPPRSPIRIPALTACLLCLSSAFVGIAIDHRFFQLQAPAPQIALAEQGAVVLEALLNRPDLDPAMARLAVGQTIATVVSRYQQRGFLVINADRGAEGQLLVESVPTTAIDITDEMRVAVAKAVATNAPANPTSLVVGEGRSAAPSSSGSARSQAN